MRSAGSRNLALLRIYKTNGESGQMTEHPWFSARGYQHLDRPIGRRKAEAIATTPSRVSRHSFLPLIGFEKQTRRYSARKGKSIKVRPIMYASHGDSAIYAYYAHVLEQHYERHLTTAGLTTNVIAYRKLGRSNYDFAKEAFDDVRSRPNATALCFDIESFFPTLDHALLKKSVEKVLGVQLLSDDWFAVFKHVTRFSWLKREDVVRVRGANLTSARDGSALSVQQIHDLRTTGHMHRNPDRHGIPQGLPISSLLANVYMLEFDQRIASACKEHGATYRRYSDDILIVCNPEDAGHFRALVEKELNAARLTSNTGKFEETLFTSPGDRHTANRSMQYLGFVFDGEDIRIRSSSLSRFYRRMAKAVRGLALKASESIRAGRTRKLHRRRLYDAFSPLGKRNFLTKYAVKAAAHMGSNAIIEQTRHAPRVLRRRIEEAERKFNLPKA